jgi:hypothetical protein
MLEALEVRKAKNGVIVVVNTDEGQDEFVFDNQRKALRFIKVIIETDKVPEKA